MSRVDNRKRGRRETTIINQDYAVQAIGLTSINGYQNEVDHCVRLCKDAYNDYNLSLASNTITSRNYVRKRKHRLQYACLTGNFAHFDHLFSISNATEVLQIQNSMGETLMHHVATFPTLLTSITDHLGGRLQILRSLLNQPTDRQVNPDKRNNLGETPLYLASYYGMVQLVQELLQQPNIAINSQNIFGFSPIHAAVLKNQEEIVRILINVNNINLLLRTEEEQDTPLSLASTLGRTSIVQMLLQLPTDNIGINQANAATLTPLLAAVANNRLEIVQQLCGIAATDMNALTNDAENAIILAASRNNTAIFEVLLSYYPTKPININQVSRNNGKSALHYACENANLSMIQKLCQIDGLDMNIKDSAGNIPFSVAVSAGNLAIVDELLQYITKFDINSQNNSKFTALMIAVEARSIEIVQRLCVIPTVNLELVNHINETALCLACNNAVGVISPSDLIVTALLEQSHRYNVNAQNSLGKTALHTAIYYGSKFPIHRLSAINEVNLNIKNSDGQTPLFLACSKGIKEAVIALLDNGGNNRLNINEPDSKQSTPLHQAVFNGRLDIVRLLCSFPSINLNAINKNGDTALLIAARRGFGDIVEELLKYQRSNSIS